MITFKYIRDKIRNSNQEILDIMIFNELSGKCDSGHPKKEALNCPNKYCSKRHIQRIVQQIDQAVYSIDIAIYTFTTIEILEAFYRALDRGVTIRVISDPEMLSSTGSKVLSLKSSGVEIRMPETTALMHHKFLVIDGGARVKSLLRVKDGRKKPTCVVGAVFYGSANWTAQGFKGNWENCVLSSDKLLTNRFQAEFDRMWTSFKRY